VTTFDKIPSAVEALRIDKAVDAAEMVEMSKARPVMITGASSGIGLELARHYARVGKPLVLIARNSERLQATAEELSKLSPVYQDDSTLITVVSLDVADASAVSSQLTKVVHTRGIPELLINAAGVVNVGRFLEMDTDYFDANLRIDLEGTVNTCRAIAPFMAEAGAGHIVNIASVAGYMGIYGYTGYSAAKYAVMGFSEALRFEMKPQGVSVSVVCPPDTKTPGFAAEQAARPVETEAIAGSITALCPELVARKIVRGINSRRFYIIIGASSKFYFRLKGLLPEVFFAIVDGQVRKARKTSAKTAEKALVSSVAKTATNICAKTANNSLVALSKTENSVCDLGHQQDTVLHDILTPSACLPEHNASNRGGTNSISGRKNTNAEKDFAQAMPLASSAAMCMVR
jgi:short-subunit dehydrogenase